jgi:CRP-like cAMP-binding protein
MGPKQDIGRRTNMHADGLGKPCAESVVNPATLLHSGMLRSLCPEVRFSAGERLRQKGQHYKDMYLITDGAVGVDFETKGTTRESIVVGIGRPVGEIAFLRGCAATATVTARTDGGALVINDPTLAHLEKEQPALAAQLLRYLAETAEERTNSNLTLVPRARAGHRPLDVYLCRNAEMLESAQRLRYEVYCLELGRNSPYADHKRKIIADDLDTTAQTFIAVEAGETVGTLRGNRPSEGSLGALEELYGMRASVHHPHATSVCTKFIVKRSSRGGPAAMLLIAAMVRYGVRSHVKECYIDCIPALLPYYKAIGFKIAGPPFFHRENGPSSPMVIDLVKHGDRLSEEFGPLGYLRLYLKAKILKWIDRPKQDAVAGLVSSLGGK